MREPGRVWMSHGRAFRSQRWPDAGCDGTFVFDEQVGGQPTQVTCDSCGRVLAVAQPGTPGFDAEVRTGESAGRGQVGHDGRPIAF